MFITTKEKLARHLRDDLGLKNKDLVFLHSGLIGLGHIDGGLNTITDAFSEVLAQGILIIPTFSYSWCKGELFEPLETECPDMGMYAGQAWKDKRFLRSSNPNFSVAALQNRDNGKLIKQLFNTAPTCFGISSVFDNMYKLSHLLDGYVVLLGGAHNDVVFRTTFIHYIEEKVCVPYRYLKKIANPRNDKEYILQLVRFLTSQEYIEVRGEATEKYNFPVKYDYALLGRDLIKNGLIKIRPLGYSQTRIVAIKDFCDFLEKKLKDDPNYCLEKRKLDELIIK